jgi:hypothetical protein
MAAAPLLLPLISMAAMVIAAPSSSGSKEQV